MEGVPARSAAMTAADPRKKAKGDSAIRPYLMGMSRCTPPTVLSLEPKRWDPVAPWRVSNRHDS